MFLLCDKNLTENSKFLLSFKGFDIVVGLSKKGKIYGKLKAYGKSPWKHLNLKLDISGWFTLNIKQAYRVRDHYLKTYNFCCYGCNNFGNTTLCAIGIRCISWANLM